MQTIIEKGLCYLQKAQKPTGEFTTYTAPKHDMSTATPYPKSTYVTALIIDSLCNLPPHPLRDDIINKAATFLVGEQEQNGAWNYEGRGHHRVPDDLDTIACVVAALFRLGRWPDYSFYPILWGNETTPGGGGPYRTWLVNDDTNPMFAEVEPLVNANILYCCNLLNIDLNLHGTEQYLTQFVPRLINCLINNKDPQDNLYAFQPFLIYCLSRAYATTPALAPIKEQLQTYIINTTLPQEAFNLACITNALLKLNTAQPLIMPYFNSLIKLQQPDGHWPAWAAWKAFYPNFDGAASLSTALALDAIHTYINTEDNNEFNL